MEKNEYDLSICIPTYNRCEILSDTLKTLLSDPGFDASRVEIIVSDNCSTDRTKSVVAQYPQVKYFCNDVNVRDENFAIALEYANGKYIRLFNDTLSFKENMLANMLAIIETEQHTRKALFFYDNTFLNKNCKKDAYGIDGFLKEASFYTTWIANFGCWREDFANVVDKKAFVKRQFAQVDWTYQIVKNNKDASIYFNEFFNVATPNNKGGYNIFDIFVNNYLFILKQHKPSLANYEIEKYRLCTHFIYPWLIKLFLEKDSQLNFDKSKAYEIIFLKYWYTPYFYVMLARFWFNKIRR